MTKPREKTPALSGSPALALSRGLFGAPAPGASGVRHEKTPPPEGGGALQP